jgi:hypothetical protein
MLGLLKTEQLVWRESGKKRNPQARPAAHARLRDPGVALLADPGLARLGDPKIIFAP